MSLGDAVLLCKTDADAVAKNEADAAPLGDGKLEDVRDGVVDVDALGNREYEGFEGVGFFVPDPV